MSRFLAYPGIVEPAHFSAPEYAYTLGGEVADLCTLVNYGPDPEQRLGLDIIFGRRHDHRSAAFEFACIACRQNLKTGLFKQATIGWLFLTDERLIVWSAHIFDTAQEAFRDLEELITGSDYLRRRVKKVSHSHGDESIETVTGGRLIFKARTSGGGRGLSGRKVILDEGMALVPSHMGALLPTLSAQPDPQVLYGSSAGLAMSAVLRGVRDRGRKGRDARLGYIEYCAPDPKEACERGESCDHTLDTPGCGCDKPELIRLANPAVGRRIMLETIVSERRALPPEEYGRERMGWWDDPADGIAVIDPITWAKQGDTKSTTADPVALAFDVRPGNLAAAVGSVGRLLDVPQNVDIWRGDIVEHRSGTDWLVERLAQICLKARPHALIYDPSSPAGAFEKALLAYRLDANDPRSTVFVKLDADEDVPKGKTRLAPITAREYAQACGALDADIRNELFRHFDQLPLNEAVEGARTSPLADAWKWSRKDSSVDISPLVAVTLARHGFATFGGEKPKPRPWALSS